MAVGVSLHDRDTLAVGVPLGQIGCELRVEMVLVHGDDGMSTGGWS